ncbi:MAG TPA: hypothetical protein VHZ02_08080 [Acidimicrobiales bacterium]|nr:hypothetical protein [Acidimicrobiales bacterium]
MNDTDGPERIKQPEAEAVEGGGIFQSRADGQLHFSPESVGSTDPITAPIDATPLEEDEPEGVIPPSPLWAMKDKRHEQWVMFGHADRIRSRFGAGDSTVYVIDDGKHHCMIGRRVGATLDGCVYSLVARIDRDTYVSLEADAITAQAAFARSHEAALVATAEGDGVSNLFDIDNYRHPDDIPPQYLPPHAFIEFARDLPAAEH